jgi:hypothetical protein
MLPSLQLVDG